MGWLDGWLVQESIPWMYGRLRDDVSPVGNLQLTPDECYVNVVLRSIRLAAARQGTRRYYGMVSSTSTLVHEGAAGGGTASFTAVSAPESLRALDPAHQSRVVTSGTRLLGPRPYRGGDLTVDIALLSVQEGDLAEPFLSLLARVADVAGVGLLGGVLQLAKPLVSGVNDLLQKGAAELEAGASLTWQTPWEGTFVVTQYDARMITPEQVGMSADWRLLDPSGNPMAGPYLVFTVEASRERADWSAIPDIANAWEQLQLAVRGGRHDAVDDAVAAFRRTALLSPDLLSADGQRLVERAEARVSQALAGGRTAIDPGRTPLPALREVGLYA